MNEQKKREQLKRYFGPQVNLARLVGTAVALFVGAALLRVVGAAFNLERIAVILAVLLAVSGIIATVRIVWYALTRANLWQMVVGVVLADSLLIAVLNQLDIFPQTNLRIVSVLIIIATLLLCWFTYRVRLPTDQLVQSWLEADWRRVALRSAEKLGITAHGPNQDRITEPLAFTGWIVDEEEKTLRGDIPRRRRNDNNLLQCAANRVVVFEFTQDLIGVYMCDYNSLEEPEYAILEEKTFECFYRDMVSFETKDRDVGANIRLGRFNLKDLNNIGVVKRLDARLNDLEPPEGVRWIAKQFAVVAINQQFLGTTMVVECEVGDDGSIMPHEVDGQIEAIREMVRQKKRHGTPGNPFATNQFP
jgi:hypothetical protein